MSAVKLEIISLGKLPKNFNINKLKKLNSKVFSVLKPINSYELRKDSDIDGWGYSDQLLLEQIPKVDKSDLLIVLTSVPLQDNYYTRRIDENIVVFTFYEIFRYLEFNNIPLENVIKRLLYSYALSYIRFRGKIPNMSKVTNFTHDDTRGCLFDMNGIKEDVIHSCDNPILCDECCERLKSETVSLDVIQTVKSELRGIKKYRYYRIIDKIRQYPVLFILLSSSWAVALGVLSTLIVKYLE